MARKKTVKVEEKLQENTEISQPSLEGVSDKSSVKLTASSSTPKNK